MKVISALVSSAALFAGALADANCVSELPNTYSKYHVTATGVGDIPGICGGLWDNLKTFAGQCAPIYTHCDGTNGNLDWGFQAETGCTPGMVESTWWEATKNQWGSIVCAS